MRAKKFSWSKLIINIFFIFVSFCMIAPLVLVIAISLTDEAMLIENGYRFIPEEIDLTAYRVLFESGGQLLRAYRVTIAVTIVGTAASVFFVSLTGYVISRRDFQFRGLLTFLIFFTILFSGGLVPTYILITRYLKLKNKFAVLILPIVFNPFLVLVARGFFAQIPRAIIESAKLDGASEFRIFLQIVLPLSKPILATLTVILSFMYWNNWWQALLYMDDPRMAPLQLLLWRMMNQVQFIASNPELRDTLQIAELPTLSLRMAMVVLAAGPVMFIFPFLQNYFIKGLTLGAQKN